MKIYGAETIFSFAPSLFFCDSAMKQANFAMLQLNVLLCLELGSALLNMTCMYVFILYLNVVLALSRLSTAYHLLVCHLFLVSSLPATTYFPFGDLHVLVNNLNRIDLPSSMQSSISTGYLKRIMLIMSSSVGATPIKRMSSILWLLTSHFTFPSLIFTIKQYEHNFVG